jgi:hypothetical protein
MTKEMDKCNICGEAEATKVVSYIIKSSKMSMTEKICEGCLWEPEYIKTVRELSSSFLIRSIKPYKP